MMKRILLADDDTDDTELFREAVLSLDPDLICDTVSDGSELLEKLNDSTYVVPDIVFLDINMPDVNGWATLKALRQDKRFSLVPVIMYTTSSAERDKQIAIDLGATYFFTKPDRFEQLEVFLSHVIKNIHSPSAIAQFPG